MKKIKIAMLASFPPPITGQGLAAKILSDGLDPEEFKIYRLNFTESVGGESFCERLRCLSGVAINLIGICIREKELIVYLQLGFGKASILRDMVFLAISRVFGKKCIAHVHGSGFRVALDGLPAPVQLLERKLLATIEKIVVLSPCLKEMFVGLVPDSKLIDIPNGVASDVVMASESFVRSRRDESQPFRVLFLSNLLRMKGYETVLYAAKLAKERGENWHFDIVGPKIPNQGCDVETFILQHELTDSVQWHDTLEGNEKMAMYKNADCFVMPSFFEGQPLCILEAMHFALPVVAKPVGGIPDIFAENSEGVAYFGEPLPMGTKPDAQKMDECCRMDAEKLIDELARVAYDPDMAYHMGQVNQALARKLYTPRSHVERVAALFRKCIEQ